MNKRIYVAGGMTGYEKSNFPAFDRNAQFLRDNGWDAISPADLDRQAGHDPNDPEWENRDFTAEDYHAAMVRDYRALTECSAIAFIPGWQHSKGAALERAFAGKLKLDMYRVDADNSYLEKELLIGLTGYAQVGKDTLANLLVGDFNFQRKGFADNLRSMLYALNPILPAPNWAKVGDNFGNNGVVRVRDYVDFYGWETAKKEVPEIRQLLQRLGTDAGRSVLGDNVWVDALLNSPNNARLVISDCRFPNECSSIKERGGVIIRVNRKGYGPINDHISETASLGFEDYNIQNEGSPEDLKNQALECIGHAGIEL
jgi:hypothetical protein